MAIPSQASQDEGVETRRGTSKLKGMMKVQSRPQTERVVKTIVARKSLKRWFESTHGYELGKVERPSKEQLLQEVKESSYLSVGKKYGVSDNSIRKWINK